MVRLTCVIIQEGSTISIVIDEGLPVYELKEAIKAEKSNDLKDVDADRLQLFLAKDGGAWLGASSDVARQLQNGAVPDAIKTLVQKDKELLGGSDIKFMWKGMNPPANDQIHVLVKLPEAFTPNKRPRWIYTSTYQDGPRINTLENVPQIDIDNNEKYVTLSAALLKACGLFSGRDLMLYRRSAVNDLWTYLRNEVVTDNKRLFVVGPAGVGKSTCVLSFAASLNPVEWSVVWIHLGAVSSCLVFRTKEMWKFADVADFVLPRIADEKLFVFVDGFKDSEAHEQFYSNVLARLDEDKDRLVVCSRIAALGKRNDDDDDLLNIESYSMYSWTEEEYHEAIADVAFYATVADKLDATSIAYEVNAEDDSDEEEKNEQEKKKQAVKSKFYYAGGSCRLMFQCTTDAVKSALEAAVRSTRNKMELVNYCRSTIHSERINVLYGMQRGGAVGRRYPVSSFAAYLMAEDCDEEVIAKLKKYLR